MENTMDNEIKYRTVDLYLATYLEEKGERLEDVQVYAGGKRVEFIFPASAAAVAETYGQGQVNARSFSHTLRDLKIKMYAAKAAN